VVPEIDILQYQSTPIAVGTVLYVFDGVSDECVVGCEGEILE
jgi:hypothetical protein